MQLVFAQCCKYCEVSADGSFTVVGGGLSAVGSATFPAALAGLGIIAQVRFEQEELGQTFAIGVELFDQQGQRMPDFNALVSLRPERNDRVPDLNRTTFAIYAAGLAFPAPARYEFRMHCGEQELGSVPLYLIQAEPPAQG